MVRWIQMIFFVIAAITLVYYVTISLILRFSIDQYVFPQTSEEITNEIEIYKISNNHGNQVLVRRYGNNKSRCVVFFPGQHGGVVRYEKSLFNLIVNNGITVFAISYPGQNGALGKTYFDQLPKLLNIALRKIHEICRINNAVFVGRSLGSMMATIKASEWRPRGLVLEGVAPRFSDAIYTFIKSKWYLYPAMILPISEILKDDYSMRKALDHLESTQIVIFQGTVDLITPLPAARELIDGRPHIEFFEIKGATHADTYIKAMPSYIDSIKRFYSNHAPNTTSHPTSASTREF